MQLEYQGTKLLAIVFLIMSLFLSACSISGDDDGPATVSDIPTPEVTTLASSNTVTEPPAETVEDDAAQAAPTSTGDDEATSEASAMATETSSPMPDASEPAIDLTTRIEEVTEEVRPAVVFIAITQIVNQPTGQPGEQQGVGSGVIFDAEGHILTNNHVVENADELQVVLPDGRKFDASVLGRAPKQDIAVIKIEGDDLPVATLGKSDDLIIGQWVVAIGNALGLEGGASVTVGVVSALDRSIRPSQNEPAIEGLIQTDAAINPGNSGGPLVNLEGEVVGVNTAKIPQAEGIGFAVPVDTARSIIDQIMTGEPQATLGVSAATVTPEIAVRFSLPAESGVLIIDVDAEGPADASGIQVGDVVTAVDGESVETVDSLRSAIQSHEPGDTVEVEINREGNIQQITVELGQSIVIR